MATASRTLKPRRRVSNEVRRQINQLYGPECLNGADCVICGQAVPARDLAHVDENHNNSLFENILPLCLNANGAMARDKWAPFAGEIGSANLLAGAQKQIERGNFARAYGCYRLLAYLAEKATDNELALQANASCVAVLRPIDQPLLVREAVLNMERLAKGARPISPVARAVALSQIGLIVYDGGDPNAALEIHEFCLKLLRKAGRMCNGRERDLVQSRSLQHCAAASALVARSLRDRNFVVGQLRESREIATSCKDNQRLGSAITIEAAVYHRFGDSARSSELVREGLKLSCKSSPWTRADLHLLQGKLHLSTGRRSKGIHHLRESADLLTRFRMKPEGGVFENADPGRILNELGQNVLPTGRLQSAQLTTREFHSVVRVLVS
jgi:hypothetical protein